jgi:hypothetical protein
MNTTLDIADSLSDAIGDIRVQAVSNSRQPNHGESFAKMASDGLAGLKNDTALMYAVAVHSLSISTEMSKINHKRHANLSNATNVLA